MPLHDDYQSEKQLAKAVLELMPGLTEYLNSVEQQRYAFIIMVMDMKEGLMQYAADVDRRDGIKTVKGWLKREEERLAKDKADGVITDDNNNEPKIN